MATHNFESCPHCGGFYQHYTNNTPKGFYSHDGSPFVKCKHCSKYFLDKNIQEPAFKPAPVLLSPFTCIATGVYLWGSVIILLLIAALYTKHIVAIIATIISVLLCTYTIWVSLKDLKSNNKEIILEYKESEKRLSDRNYVIALINSGYSVPKDFLEKNYPDL